jgi:hypothetical protein
MGVGDQDKCFGLFHVDISAPGLSASVSNNTFLTSLQLFVGVHSLGVGLAESSLLPRQSFSENLYYKLCLFSFPALHSFLHITPKCLLSIRGFLDSLKPQLLLKTSSRFPIGTRVLNRPSTYDEMSNESVSQSGIAEDAIYHSAKLDPFIVDIEQKALDNAHLMNDTVRSFVWQGITVVVKDHKTKQPKTILENVEGSVEAGTSYFLALALFFFYLAS